MIKKYCEQCSDFTTYVTKKELFKEVINEIEIEFEGERAYCSICNEPILIEELEIANDRTFNKLYREKLGIISVEDINKLLAQYNIGATVLCKLLKWGDVTITRYLNGQLPSAEYSSTLIKLKNSPNEMLNLLEINKDLISDVAYKKSKEAVIRVLSETAVTNSSDNIIDNVAEYIISATEVTPKALQKILYFIQGFSYIFNEIPIFDNIPQAWIHGPVYNDIYQKYKNFGYAPIEKNETKKYEFSEPDKELIDTVIKYFGCYNGNILEDITHKEMPWIKARRGLSSSDPSTSPIYPENIKQYFYQVKDKYKIINYADINDYAYSMFKLVQ